MSDKPPIAVRRMLDGAVEDLQLGKLVLSSDDPRGGIRLYGGLSCGDDRVGDRERQSPKTHSGVRSAFALLAKDHPGLGKQWGTFLAKAYEYKDEADYKFEAPIPREKAEEFLAKAAELVDLVKAMAKNA